MVPKKAIGQGKIAPTSSITKTIMTHPPQQSGYRFLYGEHIAKRVLTVFENAIMDSSDAHENQKMQLLSDSAKLVFDVVVQGQ
jgi:hypothetical protein